MLGHSVPPGSVERSSCGPGDVGAVRFSGGVFVLVGGTDFDLSIESSVIGDIGVPSMRFHDLERTGVDLVHSESGVEVGERRERGTDPVGGERRSSGFDGSIVRVSDEKSIFVSMSVESSDNYVRTISLNNFIQEIRRVGENRSTGESSGDMRDEPSLLSTQLGKLKLVRDPFECTAVVGFAGVDEVVRVGGVEIVGVVRDDAKSFLRFDGESTVMSSSLLSLILVNPSEVEPERCEMIVVPSEGVGEVRRDESTERVESLRQRVVITESCESWPGS